MTVGRTGAQFFGRADEMTVLLHLFARLERGRGPAASVVVGEPGVGKTRFVDEAVRRAGTAPAARLIGFELEQQVPLAAAGDLLRILADVPGEGTRLQRVLRNDDAAALPLDSLRVFEAAYAALSTLGRALIVFDDLQWADQMSIALCHYILRAARADDRSLALICASRPGSHVSSFTDALHRLLSGDEDFVGISLGPLDIEDGVELAKSIDARLGTKEAEELYRTAGGSPFWIETLARATDKPERTEEAISARLRGVGMDAAEFLAVLVVAGRPMRPSDLGAVLAWEGSRVDQAVSELTNAGLVSSTGSALQISHDLVREGARRQIPQRELSRLHRLLAGWFQREAHDDLQVMVEALGHERAAGGESVGLALKIARAFDRRLLGVEGLARLAAIADAASVADPDALALLTAVASLAAELGQRDLGFDRWTSLSDGLTTPDERARAALNAARLAIDMKRSSEATRLVQRARAEGEDPWVQVEADAVDHALQVWVLHDAAAAKISMQNSVNAARRLVAGAGSVDALDRNARRAYVDALTAEHDVALVEDDIARLVATSDERVAATRGLGEEHLIAQTDAATALWYLNLLREAASKLNRVLVEARAHTLPSLIAEVCHALAFTKYNLGQLDEAKALLDEAKRLEVRLATPSHRTVPWVRGGLGHLIDASRGAWQDAVGSLQKEAANEPDPHNRLRLRLWVARCAARFGGSASKDAVISEVDLIESDVAAAGCSRCRWEAHLACAEQLARVDEHDRARHLLERWDAAHPVQHPSAAHQRLRAEALVASATGRTDAVGLAEKVVASARGADLKLDELWGLIDLGAVQEADREAAVATWIAALELAGDLGANSEADLIQRNLRGLGVRARTPSRGTEPKVASLSERELEVARLAAAGSRNAEIAAALFVSLKTVERHFSNIYSKLGVRNRAELVSRFSASFPREEPSPED